MSDQEHAYKPEAWRMTDYYPDSYAKFMSSLGIGIDYDDGDYSRYESQFRADLAAHDARIASEAAERALREAADDLLIESENAEPEKPNAYREGVAAGLLQAEGIARTRANRIRAEREGAGGAA